MSQNLIERMQRAENLPSLPAVAVEILSLSRRDDTSAEDVAEVVQKDPALTARLLRVVNSSMFGIARQVTSIRQAVVLMGLRAVKVLALGFSLTDAMRGDAAGAFDYTAFWRRSLTTAAAARQLGHRMVGGLADEAFVAGLLADLGLLAACRCAADAYAPVLNEVQAGGGSILEVEQRRLGIDHATLGRELLVRWGLPEALCEAVGRHHLDQVSGAPEATRRLCALVQAAVRTAELFCGETRAALGDVRKFCAEHTGIGEAAMEEVFASLDETVRETAQLLNVQVGPTLSYAQLQAEAAQSMARLTLEAELERVASVRQMEDARRHAERLEREKEAILEMAATDSLTSTANRAALDRRMEEEIHRARRTGARVGLILLDIDHFKQFNDTFGHPAGDALLRSVSACIKAGIGPGGLVGRYGGEEFAVVVSGESLEAVARLAEQLRRAIEGLNLREGGRDMRVTASFGVACVEGVDLSVGSTLLVRLADEALYRAKRNGRNRVEVGSGEVPAGPSPVGKPPPGVGAGEQVNR